MEDFWKANLQIQTFFFNKVTFMLPPYVGIYRVYFSFKL